MLIFLNIWHFSPEHTQTWSLGATESEIWIGNFYVKARKTTKHKLHKIWRSLQFCKISGKRAHPYILIHDEQKRSLILHISNHELLNSHFFLDILVKQVSAEGNEQWVVAVDTSGKLFVRLGKPQDLLIFEYWSAWALKPLVELHKCQYYGIFVRHIAITRNKISKSQMLRLLTNIIATQ